MPEPKITFNRGSGGLGRPLAGKDHYSGFLFFYNTLPSGFAADDRIKQIFSVEEAEALGITEGSADFGVQWYHISEYFRMQPKGVLWLGYYAIPVGAYDFEELSTMQLFAQGEIRQFGVYVADHNLATVDISTLQGIVDDNQALDTPFEVLYAADIVDTAALADLPDLRALTAPNVSVVIGQDGSGKGKALYDTLGYSVCTVGTALGAVSFAKVSDSIAWVEKFQISEGLELDVAAFGNGLLYRNQSQSLLDTLTDEGYIYAKKFTGLSGTYFNDSSTSVSVTSDYAYIENNRTFNAAIRDIRTRILPKLNSPLKVQPDGTLSTDTIYAFRSLAAKALEDRLNNDEISAYSVIINPDQDVLSTSKIEITVKIVPIGVAREIVFNISFATNV